MDIRENFETVEVNNILSRNKAEGKGRGVLVMIILCSSVLFVDTTCVSRFLYVHNSKVNFFTIILHLIYQDKVSH